MLYVQGTNVPNFEGRTATGKKHGGGAACKKKINEVAAAARERSAVLTEIWNGNERTKKKRPLSNARLALSAVWLS